MIITCEKCKISYAVPTNAVGETGRNVKCAKCGHVWFAKPQAEDLQASRNTVVDNDIQPIPTGSALPVVVDKKVNILIKATPYIMAGLLAVSLLTFHSSAVIDLLPFSKSIYSSLQLYPVKNTALAEFKFTKVVQLGRNNMIINAKVVNYGKQEVSFPIVRISVKNKEGKEITKHDIEHKNQILGPGQFSAVEASITHLPDEAENISIDIGNKLNLMFR